MISAYRGKTSKHFCFFADFTKRNLGAGVLGNIMGDSECTECTEPLACIRRSGITSRTKLASFSFSHKSWANKGPEHLLSYYYFDYPPRVHQNQWLSGYKDIFYRLGSCLFSIKMTCVNSSRPFDRSKR